MNLDVTVFVAVMLVGLMVPVYVMGYTRGKIAGMSERLRAPMKSLYGRPRTK